MSKIVLSLFNSNIVPFFKHVASVYHTEKSALRLATFSQNDLGEIVVEWPDKFKKPVKPIHFGWAIKDAVLAGSDEKRHSCNVYKYTLDGTEYEIPYRHVWFLYDKFIETKTINDLYSRTEIEAITGDQRTPEEIAEIEARKKREAEIELLIADKVAELRAEADAEIAQIEENFKQAVAQLKAEIS